MEQIQDDVGVPIIVRAADLFRFAKPMLILPRQHRPIVRTKPSDGTGVRGTGLAGTRDSFIVRLFEDVAGCSTEWQDVLSGYLMLESEVSGNAPHSLWKLGRQIYVALRSNVFLCQKGYLQSKCLGPGPVCRGPFPTIFKLS